jgi:hypothetical protein
MRVWLLSGGVQHLMWHHTLCVLADFAGAGKRLGVLLGVQAPLPQLASVWCNMH